MKLNDIPAPVWYMVGAAIAAAAVVYLVKRGAAAVGEAAAAVPGAINTGATGAAQAVGLVPEGRTIGGTIFEGVQAISEFFGGAPSDSAIIATPTVVRTPLGNPRNANAPGSGSAP